MRFGYFDDKNREYVITTPRTPLPWINYLGCDDFFTLVSQTGGGYSFFRDAKLRRLTRYRYNNVPQDSEGFRFYIRDGVDFCVRNFCWQPTCCELDEFSCRHGLGYTVIRGKKREIDVSQEMFVPLQDSGEVEVEDGVIYHKAEYRERRNHFCFTGANVQPDGFDTSREAFLGAYRSAANPVAVEQGSCTQSIAHGWAPVDAQ